MSRNFAKLFSNSLQNFLLNDTRYEPNSSSHTYWIKGVLATTGGLVHCAYVIGTSKNEKSKIVKKYKMVRNGYTEFMVIDDKDRHFNVNNSLWYWKWDSIEDWCKINEGDELDFKYYGWRVPLLGLFPNIYNTEIDIKN